MQKQLENRPQEISLAISAQSSLIPLIFNTTVGKAAYGTHTVNEFALDRMESVRRPTK